MELFEEGKRSKENCSSYTLTFFVYIIMYQLIIRALSAQIKHTSFNVHLPFQFSSHVFH